MMGLICLLVGTLGNTLFRATNFDPHVSSGVRRVSSSALHMFLSFLTVYLYKKDGGFSFSTSVINCLSFRNSESVTPSNAMAFPFDRQSMICFISSSVILASFGSGFL